MPTAPTLTWKSQKIALTADTGNTAQYVFEFDAPIKAYAVGISGFNFQTADNDGINLQNFGINTSVLSINGAKITVELSAYFLSITNINLGSWVRISVVAWIDEGTGNPPVLLAQRRNIGDGQTALTPVTIPMENEKPRFVMGKDKFTSFLSGFRLSLGTPDQEDNVQTVTYVSVGAGLEALDRNLELSGKARIRGVGLTTVYQTNITTGKNSTTVQDNKVYPKDSVKTGEVDAACCILSNDLEGYEIASLNFINQELSIPQTNQARGNNFTDKFPFGKPVKDFVFLIQGFTFGISPKVSSKIANNQALVSMFNIDFWRDSNDSKSYTGYNSVSYSEVVNVWEYVQASNGKYTSKFVPVPGYYYGFSNVNGILIAKV